MKRLIKLAIVLAALGVFYWWAAVDNRMPEDAHYEFDIAQVRALADSLPGDKPGAVRYEKIMDFIFPQAMAMAGDPWSTVDISVYAYQLVYPDRTAISTPRCRARSPSRTSWCATTTSRPTRACSRPWTSPA